MNPTYTKEQLIEAVEIMYTNFKDNPDNFAGYGEPSEDAIAYVNNLINIIEGN